MPKFLFLASSYVGSETYIKEIESYFYSLIWKGKPDKVERLTLMGDCEKRGLDIYD
jgi:hypothetical protein